MWNDPKIWIPIATTIIIVTTTFFWQYLGNQEFRKNINHGLSWFWIVVIKQHFFWSIYVPMLLILSSVIITLLSNFILPVVALYSVWITIWCMHIVKRNRSVSTIVSCKLGDERSENGQDGLLYIRYSDGNAPKELLKKDFVRRSDFSSGSYYMYLRIRKDVVGNFQGKHCIVLVEFFDGSATGSFDLQYDSEDKEHPNFKYKTTESFAYSGSDDWKLAKFNLPDPAFKQRQNGNSDFRLRMAHLVNPSEPHPDIYVRKIICVSLNN